MDIDKFVKELNDKDFQKLIDSINERINKMEKDYLGDTEFPKTGEFCVKYFPCDGYKEHGLDYCFACIHLVQNDE